MKNKSEQFEYLNSKLEELVLIGSNYFKKENSEKIKIQDMTIENWERFLNFYNFYKKYYLNSKYWVIVPYLGKIGKIYGINLLGFLTFIDKKIYYEEWTQGIQTLVHEAQHDIKQFGFDKKHNKPGYQWDELIGNCLNNCLIIQSTIKK